MHHVRERIRRRLRLGPNDEFYVVHGPEPDCLTAADEIRIRWGDATGGVPKETRQSLIGGHTTFERILPGPDRMYPDTDSPPTRVTADRVARLRDGLPPPPWERHARFAGWGVPAETTDFLIRKGGIGIVEEVVRATGVDPKTAAIEIGQRGRALSRAGVPIARLGAEQWISIFHQYTDGKIPREGIRAMVRVMAQAPELDGDSAREAAGIRLQPSAWWQGELAHVDLAGYRGGREPSRDRELRYLAGRATRMLAGRAPAKEIAALLATRLEEVSR
jgi:glutamyl-tRNA(Gln) amidotransferase subunit E